MSASGAPVEVQSFYYYNSGMFICWPKLESDNSSHKWDPRGHKNSGQYKMPINKHCQFDLITVAGYKEGDIIVPGIDVEAGRDATCSDRFVVKQNGKTAGFNSGGDIGKSILGYTGLRPDATEE